MPNTSLDELHRELVGGERIEWTGRPLPGVRLRLRDAALIPFSLLWGGFAFFWEFSVWHGKAPIFFRLWGVPFALIGAYMIVGRFLVDAAVRARTEYALTNRRALIVSTFVKRTVRSVDLVATPEIGFTHSRRGLGTITFGPMEPWTSAGFRNPARAPQFEMLEDGRAVYQKALMIQQRGRKPA